MIVLMLAAIVGGVVTASLMAPFGLLLAIVAAPFGGSLCALGAGLVLARRRSPAEIHLLDTTDRQVAALRSVLEAAYPAKDEDGAKPVSGRAVA